LTKTRVGVESFELDFEGGKTIDGEKNVVLTAEGGGGIEIEGRENLCPGADNQA